MRNFNRELNFYDADLPSLAEEPNSKWRLLVLVFLFGLMLLSGLGVTLSPHIAVLCEVLNNCTKDKKFEQLYFESSGAGELALSQANQAQSLKELKQAYSRLSLALGQLEEIPENAKIYPNAQLSASYYQRQLARLNTQLNKQQQAERQLVAAPRLTEKAQDTETAKILVQAQNAEGVMMSQGEEQHRQVNNTHEDLQTHFDQRVATAQEQPKVTIEPVPQQRQALTRQTHSKRSATAQQDAVISNPSLPSFSTAPLSSASSDEFLARQLANQITTGLVNAANKREINYGTQMYQQVQVAISVLRRGQSLKEAERLSRVPSSVLRQLIEWGQSYPAVKLGSSLPETDWDRSIRLANDISVGLLVAGNQGQINYGSRRYRQVQTAILALRQGRELGEAARVSQVSLPVLDQLSKWGKQRPSISSKGN